MILLKQLDLIQNLPVLIITEGMRMQKKVIIIEQLPIIIELVHLTSNTANNNDIIT
jgi:hypothetical protein